MQLQVLRATEKPEQLVCETARNDYMTNWIGATSFETAMEDITPEKIDRELAHEVVGSYRVVDYDEAMLPKIARLIRKLMESPGHFGPFEHPHITFTVRGVSRITMAQLTRHRNVTFDIQSMRYVDFGDASYLRIPELGNDGLHGRSAEIADSIDQEETKIASYRTTAYDRAISTAKTSYDLLTDLGVAPENARAVLPLATMVNMTFTMNLRSVLHIADMRSAGDAQWEIRELTEQMVEAAKRVAPITMLTYERDLKGRKNRIAP
jgi:thymidylate synthase (FAD)